MDGLPVFSQTLVQSHRPSIIIDMANGDLRAVRHEDFSDCSTNSSAPAGDDGAPTGQVKNSRHALTP